MPDIRHRVVMSAPLDRVYGAIATTAGISGWWTRGGVQGESTEGSELQFFFGQPEPAAVMEVTRLDPDGHVQWTCIEGADEWVGTKLALDLTSTDDETVVLFTHADWREPVEFMALCIAMWVYFLFSLKSYLETGRGTPYPEDLRL